MVEGFGDEDKVLTESQDEDRAKALPPFPVFRHKGIGCSEAPKNKRTEKVRVTTITIIMKRLLDRLVNLSTQEKRGEPEAGRTQAEEENEIRKRRNAKD